MAPTEATLTLDFTVREEQTILRIRRQDPPLRVVRGFPIANAELERGAIRPLLAHLNNVSGGVLGGDQLRTCATVHERAQAQLTTTGATRLYRHRPALPTASQISHLSVHKGALLEWLPDAVIPYSGSRFSQKTSIDLAEDAALYYWEVVAPGRDAKGERFEYEHLQIELDIIVCGRPVVLERIRLEPGCGVQRQGAFNALPQLSEYAYFASLYICHAGVGEQIWLELEHDLARLAARLTEKGKVIWGASALPAHGLSVRAVAVSSRHLQRDLAAFWRLAKRKLHNQQAIMPRKIY